MLHGYDFKSKTHLVLCFKKKESTCVFYYCFKETAIVSQKLFEDCRSALALRASSKVYLPRYFIRLLHLLYRKNTVHLSAACQSFSDNLTLSHTVTAEIVEIIKYYLKLPMQLEDVFRLKKQSKIYAHSG